MRRLRVIAVGMIAALTLWAPSVQAAPLSIAPVASDGPIAAYGGWVVWSTPVPGGWGLDAWHDGKVSSLRVIPRTQPFDLDLGPDAKGRVVATFTRCSTSPTASFGRTDSWTGDDCGISVFDLITGDEHHPEIERPEGATDTTPSIWGERIAFARRDRDHGQVQQLLLYNDRTGLTKVLHHGAISHRCPFRTCRGATYRGAIQGLDLGARVAAFLWWVEAPAAAGHGGWEVRANRLSTGASLRVGSGTAGEACAEGAADFVSPSAPFVEGYEVWYSRFSSTCYADSISLVHYRTRKRGGLVAPLAGEVLQVVKTAGQLFALVAPKPTGDTRPSCTGPVGPCVLQRIDSPARFTRLPRVGSPFF